MQCTMQHNVCAKSNNQRHRAVSLRFNIVAHSCEAGGGGRAEATQSVAFWWRLRSSSSPSKSCPSMLASSSTPSGPSPWLSVAPRLPALLIVIPLGLAGRRMKVWKSSSAVGVMGESGLELIFISAIKSAPCPVGVGAGVGAPVGAPVGEAGLFLIKSASAPGRTLPPSSATDRFTALVALRIL